MEQPVILSVENLKVSFRIRGQRLYALRGVDVQLREGESLAIVGESGSGKTVLTKACSGMLEQNGTVDSGEIWFQGRNLTGLKRKKEWERIRGGQIATVFQDPMTSLNPVVTVGRQLMEVIRTHQHCTSRQARQRALEMMERVGIDRAEQRFDDYPFQYSGGMRQRIVIAIALCCQPKILICDEPTTALDVTVQAQILRLIGQLQKELGYAVLFITHDLGVVANIADRVAVMYAGQVVEQGQVEELFYDSRHPYTWALLSSLPQLAGENGELYALPGTPPSMFSQPIGDAFAARNPYCLKVDTLAPPPWVQVSQTHFVRSWLLDSRAPRVEKPEAIRNLHDKLRRSVWNERFC